MCCVGMRWLRGRLAVGLCVPPAAPRLGGAPTSATPAAPSGSTVPWVCRANSTGLSTQRCNYRWVTARAPTPAPRQPPHVTADARGRGRGVSAPRGSQLSLRPECRPQSWWALSGRRGWGAVTAAGRGRGRNGDTQPGTGGGSGRVLPWAASIRRWGRSGDGGGAPHAAPHYGFSTAFYYKTGSGPARRAVPEPRTRRSGPGAVRCRREAQRPTASRMRRLVSARARWLWARASSRRCRRRWNVRSMESGGSSLRVLHGSAGSGGHGASDLPSAAGTPEPGPSGPSAGGAGGGGERAAQQQQNGEQRPPHLGSSAPAGPRVSAESAPDGASPRPSAPPARPAPHRPAPPRPVPPVPLR